MEWMQIVKWCMSPESLSWHLVNGGQNQDEGKVYAERTVSAWRLAVQAHLSEESRRHQAYAPALQGLSRSGHCARPTDS